MFKLLKAHTALSAASPRSQVARVLQSITDGKPPGALRPPIHLGLTPRVDSPSAHDCAHGGKKSRLSSKGCKVPWQEPPGSELIVTSANLSVLLSLYKHVPDASNEALRCIANATLLVDRAHVTFINKQVSGGDFAVELLEKTTTPERIFLVPRILFLSTVSRFQASTFIRSLVESKSPCITEVIGKQVDLLSRAILSGTKLACEAMTDLSNFTFHLLLHYPKLLRTFNTLSPHFSVLIAAPMSSTR
ncbi:hypothetical protein L226DRAFT_574158 [Lentinus tigrinus ALCF2SS1-7]|uniref:Uncharacterized protein n=1 Tax=Lentinus tigrinus ALCF2SS1-6 TaxID=1328759 RepID=A0A5C2S1U3_9APHY|nr:hypothetical protein L227DRAFT_614180 [Lentinus tigrinus ALCF2SS1-6]RPD71149.1 hypothetical protein L226DRAFT_574158 [Lentinus tigrinus ALCF2SS1-7]